MQAGSRSSNRNMINACIICPLFEPISQFHSIYWSIDITNSVHLPFIQTARRQENVFEQFAVEIIIKQQIIIEYARAARKTCSILKIAFRGGKHFGMNWFALSRCLFIFFSWFCIHFIMSMIMKWQSFFGRVRKLISGSFSWSFNERTHTHTRYIRMRSIAHIRVLSNAHKPIHLFLWC